MNLLKKIPIRYIGELHDVRLINFSVDINEVKDKVPASIKVRNFDGRALFSMVDVKLKNMRPSFIPSAIHFDYRHVAFRLLVDDAVYNAGINKGLFFYRSFTDQSLIVAGGKLLTDYNLEYAKIVEKNNLVEVRQDQNFVKYSIQEKILSPSSSIEELTKTVGALDRAYSILGNTLRVTQIQREKWPIQAVECKDFENTFFKSARLEGAFKVFETIYYQWLPPKRVIL
jgi:uncharacterized protein YqjF (DUF2071 family)